ncbi:sugar ABC transporter permease [Arthrobacter sp.]|uniref:carbohydrate ABC transporter permease n=1 Tax=Arthrobacter sp. TaxID=1667 RepID=UPI0028112EB2|nr:sugar ABC transporter permease [Arthrobacter sp.]
MATAIDSQRERRIRRPRWIKEPFNSEARAGYLFILPWVIGFLVFTLGAMIYSLVISFTNYDLSTDTASPVGFSNYELLFKDPKVMTSLGNTLYYAILSVPLEICFALLLAYLLHRIPDRGAGIFRIIYYLPKMTPSVAAASIFLLLLNGNSGAINGFLGIFGIDGPQWLIDPNWMKPSIIIIGLWSVSGTMLILLAALKNVPQDLYEAAALDGAGAIRQFFSVTLPMISNALFFCTIVLTIAALQVFDQAFLLFYRDTQSGSPDAALFVGVYLFQQAFQQFNMGFAAAIAWLLFVIILLITIFQVRFGNKFVYYEGGR